MAIVLARQLTPPAFPLTKQKQRDRAKRHSFVFGLADNVTRYDPLPDTAGHTSRIPNESSTTIRRWRPRVKMHRPTLRRLDRDLADTGGSPKLSASPLLLHLARIGLACGKVGENLFFCPLLPRPATQRGGKVDRPVAMHLRSLLDPVGNAATYAQRWHLEWLPRRGRTLLSRGRAAAPATAPQAPVLKLRTARL